MGKVREAMKMDLESILNIKNYFIENTFVQWDWHAMSMEQMTKWFEQHGWPGRPLLVYEEDDKVVGFGSLSDFRPQDGYWPIAECGIYMAPGYEHKGYGSAILDELLTRAKRAGLKAIIAVIDAENTASLQMVAKHNFEMVGEMQNVGDKFGELRSVKLMIYYVKS